MHRLHKVDEEPLDPHWRWLYSTTREFEDEWERVFRDALKEAAQDGSVQATAEAVETGDLTPIEAKPPINPVTLATGLAGWTALTASVYERAAKAEMRRLGFGARLRFDLSNPYAEQWITQHTAELVTNITEETRQAMRSLVLEGFQQGIPPRRFAIRIREWVGLTERDSKAVLRYWRLLNEDATRRPQVADDMADTYARKLLRRRATLIARSETVNAAANGLHGSVLSARDNGLIAPTTQREWIAAAGSGRTCPYCLDLDGKRVGIDEPWQSTLLGRSVMNPGLHPACRCTWALVTEIPESSPAS